MGGLHPDFFIAPDTLAIASSQQRLPVTRQLPRIESSRQVF
jgi:hypothetical protein